MHVPCEICQADYQMSPGTLQELGGKFICEDCKKNQRIESRLQIEMDDNLMTFELPDLTESKTEFDSINTDTTEKWITPAIESAIENGEIKNELPSITEKEMILPENVQAAIANNIVDDIDSGSTETELPLKSTSVKLNRLPKRKGKK